MNKLTALPEWASFKDERSKFGYRYFESVAEFEGNCIEFPYFQGYSGINSALLEIIGLLRCANQDLTIRLIYGDVSGLSLSLNGSIVLNFSTVYDSLITPTMVLGLRGLSKKDINKALHTAGKGLVPIYDSLRFAHNGVRIDARCPKSADLISLRVSKSNKSNKNGTSKLIKFTK